MCILYVSGSYFEVYKYLFVRFYIFVVIVLLVKHIKIIVTCYIIIISVGLGTPVVSYCSQLAILMILVRERERERERERACYHHSTIPTFVYLS